ncbi:hypothetical protein GF362_02580 [Candidatus Dojkabacteria bacterium]|nr:hypothetical protein [Candidatus Dojkabacteria bacterium]
MSKDDDALILKIKGDFAKQIKEMKEKLGVESEMDVVRQGLSLLYYAMGSELKIERKKSNQTLIFEQFKDKDPF